MRKSLKQFIAEMAQLENAKKISKVLGYSNNKNVNDRICHALTKHDNEHVEFIVKEVERNPKSFMWLFNTMLGT